MHPRPAARARRATWRHAVLPALLLLTQPALGAGFQVSPVRAEIIAPDTVADFELRNPGSETVTVQIDTVRWRQHELAEHFEPATGLLVVPRIARVAPGKSQRIRIALRGAQATREDSYRVHFREVPAAMPLGFVGVRTTLKMDIPLFFRAAEAAPEQVDWHVLGAADNALELRADNKGARHFTFSHARVTTAGGAVLAEDTGPRYVLAGSQRQWPLTTRSRPAAGTAVTLVVVSGGIEQRFDVVTE
jgi:fimbrial chaperone protein